MRRAAPLLMGILYVAAATAGPATAAAPPKFLGYLGNQAAQIWAYPDALGQWCHEGASLSVQLTARLSYQDVQKSLRDIGSQLAAQCPIALTAKVATYAPDRSLAGPNLVIRRDANWQVAPVPAAQREDVAPPAASSPRPAAEAPAETPGGQAAAGAGSAPTPLAPAAPALEIAKDYRGLLLLYLRSHPAVAGWFGLQHYATNSARDRIDGFLIRNDLRGRIYYSDISGSIFGSATLTGVQIKVNQAASIKVDSLTVSEIDYKSGRLVGARLDGRGVDVPILTLARSQRDMMDVLKPFLEQGYTTLKGNVGLAASYNDQKGTLSLELSDEFPDAHSMSMKLTLSAVNAGMMDTAYRLVESLARGDSGNMLNVALGGGMQALGAALGLELASAELTADVGGMVGRMNALPAGGTPDDGRGAPLSPPVSEEVLVKAGALPSDAREIAATFQRWTTRGGTLRIATRLATPLPLFKPTGGFIPIAPTISSFEGFLVATQAKVSG